MRIPAFLLFTLFLPTLLFAEVGVEIPDFLLKPLKDTVGIFTVLNVVDRPRNTGGPVELSVELKEVLWGKIEPASSKKILFFMQGRGTTGLKVGDRVIAMGKPDVNRKAFITDSIGLYRWTPENKALVVKAAKATRLSGVQENAGSANTGWKTYRDKDIGFTMPYLEAWIVEQSPAKRDSPDRTVSFIVPVPSGKQAFILVERHWLGGTSFESAIGQLHGDPKIRIEKAVLGDESAYKVTESRKGLRSVAYYIDGGKTMWSINFFAREEDEWDEFESRFESVRQGFRLTTKSEPTE